MPGTEYIIQDSTNNRYVINDTVSPPATNVHAELVPPELAFATSVSCQTYINGNPSIYGTTGRYTPGTRTPH